MLALHYMETGKVTRSAMTNRRRLLVGVVVVAVVATMMTMMLDTVDGRATTAPTNHPRPRIPPPICSNKPPVKDQTFEYLHSLFPCLLDSLPKRHTPTALPPNCWFWNMTTPPDPVMCPAEAADHARLQHHPVICLPSVFVLGSQRTGTTALYKEIKEHPMAFGTRHEEIHYWTRYVDGRVLTTKDVDASKSYTLFQYSRTCCDRMTLDPDPKKIEFEGSASTLWDISLLGATLPALMRVVNPSAKFVARPRNPTERLYSDYRHFHKHWGVNYPSVDPTPQHFHEVCAEKVRVVTECLNRYDVKTCLLCAEFRYFNMDACRLELGMYEVFLREWFDAFPRHHFNISPLEDSSGDDATHRRTIQEIFSFIGLQPADETVMAKILASDKHADHGRGTAPMLKETRDLLDSFYQPFNTRLAALLRDDRFLKWNRHGV
eukprot:TRINITY_DN1043_c1_g2_i3.p1 TRINITY_DN1043_c1_g2~~TRINITY_DN1043_c1_g2_i3.p1  ORF type:complete len:434 (+),score=33.25 TRINITY_DN1043_c1_g2_i3:150-1451(+)